jgi:hypothetical protein
MSEINNDPVVSQEEEVAPRYNIEAVRMLEHAIREIKAGRVAGAVVVTVGPTANVQFQFNAPVNGYLLLASGCSKAGRMLEDIVFQPAQSPILRPTGITLNG